MNNAMILLFVLALGALAPAAAGAQAPVQLMPQSPTLSQTRIAFALGGSLWIMPREGGEAHRLVVGDRGNLSGPLFSPDGSLIAFTGDFDGNQDVYVVPAAGGEMRRLTSHPGSDVALGWTPDGKRVLFRSTRDTWSRFEKLFSVAVEGGFPSELPLPMGVQGSYSADARRLAYVPVWNRRPGASDAYIAIKNYRGGKTSYIWIANLADASIARLPRAGNANDFNPMWVGEQLYFLSDRAGATTLFSFDLPSGQVRQLLDNTGFDFKAAAAGPGGIVYEQFGSLHLYDFASGREHAIPLTIADDLAAVHAHFEKPHPKQVLAAAISPSGARALFEVHGEILSIPAEKGDVRNLTRSPGAADRTPAWSPDGKSIAWFSDASGEYALQIGDPAGLGPVRSIPLAAAPSFYYDLSWSPDSRKLVYSDKWLRLWTLDLAQGKPVLVDTDRLDSPAHAFTPAWSPDSSWLAYTRVLANNLHAVFVYSLATGKVSQFTDGMSDARYPAFDAQGKWLYFTASTDTGLGASWLDMSSEAHPQTRTVYLAVLTRDQASPLAPESDEEKDDAGKPAAAGDDGDAAGGEGKPAKGAPPPKPPEPVRIELEGLDQRILALPLPARNYFGLAAGKTGIVYLLEGPQVDLPGDEARKLLLQRFDLKKRKAEKLLEDVEQFYLAAKGDKMLWKADDKWFIADAAKPPKAGEGALPLDKLEVWVDPRAEWRQMYREVWRIEREFFYDPHYHGLDLALAERTYAPFVDGIASRADLNYLFAEMLGQFSAQHMYVRSVDRPELRKVKVGLLGADYALDHGRYRFARVYGGESWNPALKAPLTQPGVNVSAGEYLLAVDGRELQADEEIYARFLGLADRQVVLRVGPRPDGSGARNVTVVPLANDAPLRNQAWIEGNRRKVDALSGGRLAYVYLPDTYAAGFTSFNRYYFAQVGKQGAVLDERFNAGGLLADYIVDHLRRPLLSLNLSREGEIASSPGEAIYGPKAMIINDFAGSGGDAMPWYFRKLGIGPLIGTRTWGGLIGIGDYPALIDGGAVTAPRWALFGTSGAWEVENIGIAPDIEVELEPQAVLAGRDPQLEKAVQVLLDELQQHPLPVPAVPAYPRYTPRMPPPAR